MKMKLDKPDGNGLWWCGGNLYLTDLYGGGAPRVWQVFPPVTGATGLPPSSPPSPGDWRRVLTPADMDEIADELSDFADCLLADDEDRQKIAELIRLLRGEPQKGADQREGLGGSETPASNDPAACDTVVRDRDGRPVSTVWHSGETPNASV